MPRVTQPRIVEHSRRSFLCLLALATPLARAADDPSDGGDYRLVVPVEPGGGIDFVARLVARAWTERRLSVVVVNRPGASGLIGTSSVASARPDGRTLLVTGVSHLTGPLLHGATGYDPLADFVPVARLASAPNVLLVGARLKDMDLTQILRDPRSSQEGFSFGSAGYGHTSHLAAEVFMARTGAKWLHVPYKGTSPATRGLLGGEVDILFAPLGSVAAATATGRARAVAVAHRERPAVLRDTPTLQELGIRDAEFSQWYGLLAPKGTPADLVSKLASLALEAVGSPAVASQLRSQGIEPAPLGPEAFSDFLAQENRRLTALTRSQPLDRPVK